jgi:hypothetical protein
MSLHYSLNRVVKTLKNLEFPRLNKNKRQELTSAMKRKSLAKLPYPNNSNKLYIKCALTKHNLDPLRD